VYATTQTINSPIVNEVEMKHWLWRESCWATGFLTLLMGLYVGAYLALVDTRPAVGVFMGVGPWPLDAHYRIGNEVSKVLFAPLEGRTLRSIASRGAKNLFTNPLAR